MDFLKDLASSVGELKANIRRPLRELEWEQRRNQLAEALDHVIALDRKRQQAANPQIPLRKVDWTRSDELTMAQQMKLAGIDPGAIAEDKMADARLKAFNRSMEGVDNPYALGNLANSLDVSPVRSSSGVFYDRYNTSNPIINMTDAVREDGLSKRNDRLIGDMRLQQLKKIWADNAVPESIKTDALNNKAITKTQQVKVVGKDGKTQYADAILTPSGWQYAPAKDKSGDPLRVPADGQATTLARNLRLVADTWDIPREEALEYLLLSKQKSQAQMRSDLYMKAAGNPMMAGDMNATNQFVDDMLGAMYPDGVDIDPAPYKRPPSPTVKEQTSSPETESKTPPPELISQAIRAINQGADRDAVMERIGKMGFVTEGLDL